MPESPDIAAADGQFGASDLYIGFGKGSNLVNRDQIRPVNAHKGSPGQHIFNAVQGLFDPEGLVCPAVDDDIVFEALDIEDVVEENLDHFPVGPQIDETLGLGRCRRINFADAAKFIDGLHKALKGNGFEQVV